MSNFKIVREDDKFRIMPLTPIGESLCDHCQFHGDLLTYASLDCAVAMLGGMENAVQNRKGQPWMRVRKEMSK